MSQCVTPAAARADILTWGGKEGGRCRRSCERNYYADTEAEEEDEEEKEEDLFVFNDTVEGPRAPEVRPRREGWAKTEGRGVGHYFFQYTGIYFPCKKCL